MSLFHNAQNFVINGGTFIAHAADRVDILDKLKERVSFTAAYNSGQRESTFVYLQGTRTSLLDDIFKWADRDDGRPIFWLHGPAGSGKSTTAAEFAMRCAAKGRLAGSFFFSRDETSRRGTTHFFTTLAYQLAVSFPEVREELKDIFEGDPSLPTKRMEEQLQQLLLRLLRRLNQSSPTRVIVIDALDECELKDAVELIKVLADSFRDQALPIRFFITSRGDDHIRGKFRLYSELRESLDLMTYAASDDIRHFLRDRFSKLYDENWEYMDGVDIPWPSDSDLENLVSKSEGLFIYASTLVKFVGALDVGTDLPHERLIKAMSSHDGLDNLYKQVLAEAPHHASPEFRQILGGLVVLRDLLPVSALAMLLQLSGPARIMLPLRGCRSILQIPEDNTQSIRFFHASFNDFLVDPERSGGEYYVNPIHHHVVILDGSVRIMLSTFTSASSESSGSGKAISSSRSALVYACYNWYHHALDITNNGGMEYIQSHLGSRFVEFLEHLGSDWFEQWLIVEPTAEYKWKFYEAGDNIFVLAKMMKDMYDYGNKLFKPMCIILKTLEVGLGELPIWQAYKMEGMSSSRE